MKLMNRVELLVITFVFLLPLSARSEIKEGSFELGSFGGYNYFGNRQNLENRPVYGRRVGYNFTSNFSIEAAGEFIKTSFDDKIIRYTRYAEISPFSSVV